MSNYRDRVPLLLANLWHYSVGDHVETPFGSGFVCAKSHPPFPVSIRLQIKATLHAQRKYILPQYRSLACGELPKGSSVYILPEDSSQLVKGEIISYHFSDELYAIQCKQPTSDPADAIWRIPKSMIRLAEKSLVYVELFGFGLVSHYSCRSDSYEIAFDNDTTGFISASSVLPIDQRWKRMLPAIASHNDIFGAFDGRISLDDAVRVQLRISKIYQHLESYWKKHAALFSLLLIQVGYASEYRHLVLHTWLDPIVATSFLESVWTAFCMEGIKLKEFAMAEKMKFESSFLTPGKSLQDFIAQTLQVLSQVRQSSELRTLSVTIQDNIIKQWENVLRMADDGNNSIESRKDVVIKDGEETVAKTEITQKTASHSAKALVISNLMDSAEKKLLDVYIRKFDFGVLDKKSKVDAILLRIFYQYNFDTHCRLRSLLHEIEHWICKWLQVDSIMGLTPAELSEKLQQRFPDITMTVTTRVHLLQQTLQALQHTPQGRTFKDKLSALVQSIDDPDLFCTKANKIISSLSFQKLSAWGSTLMSNRDKRQQVVNNVKDQCIDFFVTVLPSLKLDVLHGVYQQVEYTIAGLDVSRFRICKNHVQVRMGTVADEDLIKIRARRLRGHMHNLSWTFAQKYFPYINGSGMADAALNGGLISLGLKAEKVLVHAVTQEYKPVLALNSIDIEIRDELKLSVQKSWFSAVYNMLTSMFATLIREYVAKAIEAEILKHLVKFLRVLNDQIEAFWPLIFQILDIRVEDLPIAKPWRGAKAVEIQPDQVELTFANIEEMPFTFDKGILHRFAYVSGHRVLHGSEKDINKNHHDITKKHVEVGSPLVAINGLSCSRLTAPELRHLLPTFKEPFVLRFSSVPEDTSKTLQAKQQAQQQRIAETQIKIVSVTFTEPGSYGIRLLPRPLSNYSAIVVGFGQDSSKSVPEGFERIQVGHIIVKVNDIDLRFYKLPRILDTLRNITIRPVTLQFASSPDIIVPLRVWPPRLEFELEDDDEGIEEDLENAPLPGAAVSAPSETASDRCTDSQESLNQITESIKAKDDKLFKSYVIISAFTRVPSFAQKCRRLELGDVLLSVEDSYMITPYKDSFASIMSSIRSAARAKQALHATFIPRRAFDLYLSKQNQMKKSKVATEKVIQKSFDDADKKEITFPNAAWGIIFDNISDQAAYIQQYTSSKGAAELTKLLHIGHAILQICGENVGIDATPSSVQRQIDNVASAPYSVTVRDLELEHALYK